MSAPSDFGNNTISTCLTEQYGITPTNILPLEGGADQNASVYHVTTADTSYLLKLRQGDYDEKPLLIQQYLHNKGIVEVRAPITTLDHRIAATSGAYNLVLYPFIVGKSTAEAPMSLENWVVFGQVMRRIHAMKIPETIHSSLQIETYSSKYPAAALELLSKIKGQSYLKKVAAKSAKVINEQSSKIDALIAKTNNCREFVLAQSLPLVLCHGDIHAGNRFISNQGEFRIIDFDEPILAPKERDLMFVGGGVINTDSSQETESFYQGYGSTSISKTAIAYFRCRRVLEDIVLFGDDIFGSELEGSDDEINFGYLLSNFTPGGVLDIAMESEI
ncbi:MAG: phosphotransferase [bacterium]